MDIEKIMEEGMSEEYRMDLLEKFYPVGIMFHDPSSEPEVTLGIGEWEKTHMVGVYKRVK